MKQFFLSLILIMTIDVHGSISQDLPDTGVSGVYEVMVGSADAEKTIQYFGEFGFSLIDEATISAKAAKQIYGFDSALTSYRLQNGNIGTHGLLRVLEWKNPSGPGVGFSQPETVGVRMSVMRTNDIFRLADIYQDLREEAQEPWLVAGPVFDDLYGSTKGKLSITNRRAGVREMGIYGQLFNHVFFQRYGYTIPGYGTIADDTPLRTSEFTHHDFFVEGDLTEVTAYYSSVFGLRSENEPVIDGEWQAGPRVVFQMEAGRSHWYRGFVSPNNICGKIKLFSTYGLHETDDRSHRQRIGELGITLHSLWTPNVTLIHRLAKENGLAPPPIGANEFGEPSFLLTGPDGVSWQIIGKNVKMGDPVTEFKIEAVNN